MYLDRNGEKIKQVTVWLPVAVYQLVRADGLNLSQFIRDQLDVLYGEQSTSETLGRKVQLIESARESLARQKAVADETLGARERLRDVALRVRGKREAERAQQQESEAEAASKRECIRKAVDAIIGGSSLARYRRALPENDTFGDRIDDWEELIAGVSRRCGTRVEGSEVAAELRRCIARADAMEEQ